MKRIFSLVLISFLLCLAAKAWAAPVAPAMSYTVDGTHLSITWDSGPEATGYKLNYVVGAYTDPSDFTSMDLADQTGFSYEYLVEGQTYTIAIQVYNDIGDSGYSNIESFTVPIPQPPVAPVMD